eukprot:CAMPEP_0197664470 /NCGR_PEP_ID=MMETSP1338-20131121/58655_1 /TAXON_ID=43686 ORGANISM="Pelagodinium beii, Strain RCC1491" /NCGR_SAMPLE_ID=MMETSP1338 /ASSEMBLY_ACC=CAM_ASM_000754 /LENGTH=250 /DNA_ID=CAMNT_0043243113 /DNA_START=415 /DNA_END=1167 /DNA_ORIENTATION=-
MPPGCMKPPVEGAADGAAGSLSENAMEAVQSSASTAATVIGASKMKVHLGPLELGQDGMVVKPKFNIGIQGGSLYAMAGIRDVRDGLAAEGLAMYMKSYSSQGATLLEMLENVKAEEKIPALDDLVEAVPKIIAEALEITGVDIGKDLVASVEGAVYIYVGAGVTAGVYFGWINTQGYRMLGAEGKVAAATALGITVMAGLHDDLQAVRIVSYLTNVGFDVVVKLKQKAKSTMQHKTELTEEEDGLKQQV